MKWTILLLALMGCVHPAPQTLGSLCRDFCKKQDSYCPTVQIHHQGDLNFSYRCVCK